MKTIDVLLHDDTANGIVEYVMNTYNVIGYRFKREQLKEVSSKLENIHNSGVYLLFGDNNDVYVGQGAEKKDGVLGRLRVHNSDEKKDWWTDTAVFISANNYLGSTHVKYLEKEIYDEIKKVGRFQLKNSQTPGGQSVTRKEEEESKEFMQNIMSIVSLMGYRVFEKIAKQSDIKAENILYLTYKGETVATGAVTDDGFTIFEGSKIASDIKPGISKSLIATVEKERASQDIKDKVFINNHPVSSPSMAGTIILGINTNGRTAWKNKDGKTLRDLSEE